MSTNKSLGEVGGCLGRFGANNFPLRRPRQHWLYIYKGRKGLIHSFFLFILFFMFMYVRMFLWMDGYRRKVAPTSPKSLKARHGKAWHWGSILLQVSPAGGKSPQSHVPACNMQSYIISCSWVVVTYVEIENGCAFRRLSLANTTLRVRPFLLGDL